MQLTSPGDRITRMRKAEIAETSPHPWHPPTSTRGDERFPVSDLVERRLGMLKVLTLTGDDFSGKATQA